MKLNLEKRIAIIGGGSSVKNYLPSLWDKLYALDMDVMSLNKAFLTMSYAPDFQVWLDNVFFQRKERELLDLTSEGVFLISEKCNDYNSLPINQLVSSRVSLDLENKILFKGLQGLTGTFAISLALLMRYKKIYLFGYDYGLLDGNVHYYEQGGCYQDYVYQDEDGSTRKEVSDYDKFLPYKHAIINTSLESKINTFHKQNFDEVVK